LGLRIKKIGRHVGVGAGGRRRQKIIAEPPAEKELHHA